MFRLSRLLLVLLFALPLTLGLTATAHAAPAQTATSTTCGKKISGNETTLPLGRWGAGTGDFHSRLNIGAIPGADLMRQFSRHQVSENMFKFGNVAWVTAVSLVEASINFCALDKIGGIADEASGKIGQSLQNTGVVAALVVFTVIGLVWNIGRRGGNGIAALPALLQKALIVGLLGIMVTGAAQSTGGGIDNSNAPYKPGRGSPGWFAVTIDNIVSSSASALATNWTEQGILGAETFENRLEKSVDHLGCADYVSALKKRYRKSQGRGFSTQAAATTPLLLSAMWEQSGLNTWIKAQFGENNDYGVYSYCRMLEYEIRAPRTSDSPNDDDMVTVQRVMRATKSSQSGNKTFTIGEESGSYPLAWRYSSSNDIRDRQWIGWAACASPDGKYLTRKGGTVRSGRSTTDIDLAEACEKFFTDPDWDGHSGFEWGKSNKDLNDASYAPARDFIETLHGSSAHSGIIEGVLYMFSSIIVLIVFGLFAIAVFVAKVMALMLLITIIFALLAALLPNANTSRLLDHAKMYVGMSLFAWSAQFLLAVLALITALLINAGDSMTGGDGFFNLLWTGLAPLIALLCMHLIFKKLRIPSPLSINGGMAWGRMMASGAVGGAAGAGMATWLNRGRNQLRNRFRDGADRTRGAAGAGRGGDERTSTMAPQRDGQAPSKAGAHTGQPTTQQAARSERLAAKQAAKDAKAGKNTDMATAQRQVGKENAVLNRLSDRIQDARERFADKSALGKAGAVTRAVGKGALMGAAGLTAAAVGAPALAAVAGYAGWKTWRKASTLRGMSTQQKQVEAYRRAQNAARQRQAQADQQRAQTQQAANKQAQQGRHKQQQAEQHRKEMERRGYRRASFEQKEGWLLDDDGKGNWRFVPDGGGPAQGGPRAQEPQGDGGGQAAAGDQDAQF